MSHWTLISLYYYYETNQGEQNTKSASKINVGSFCNPYLALRLIVVVVIATPLLEVELEVSHTLSVQ